MATKQQPPKKKMTNVLRLSLFWAILVFVVLMIIAFTSPQSNLKEVSFSDVIRRANSGEIAKLEIQNNDIKVTPKGQQKPTERSVKEAGSSIYEQGLKQDATEVSISQPSDLPASTSSIGSYSCGISPRIAAMSFETRSDWT